MYSKVMTEESNFDERLQRIVDKLFIDQPKSLTRKQLTLLRDVLCCFRSNSNIVLGSEAIKRQFVGMIDVAFEKHRKELMGS